MQLSGQGFVVAPDDVSRFSTATNARLLRRYITGRDVTQEMREQYVLDTFGLTHDEPRDRYPDAFKWLHDRVKREREQNPHEKYRREWWIHAEPRGKFRATLTGLRRFVVTSRTARHWTFRFLDASFLPETKVLIFAFEDAFHLGVLSSPIHVLFANSAGGWLGVGNDSIYHHSDCLEKFPFPTATEAQQTRVRELAERLDTHRKRQQAQHPKLTLTDCYNVLEKLRAGTPLNAKEQLTQDHGLVTVLRQLHDDLDAAVAEAYGWPADSTDDEILTRLVALNAEREAEESRGQIRWLRPAFQNPNSTATQTLLVTGDEERRLPAAASAAKLPWPKTLAEQAQAVRVALGARHAPPTRRRWRKLSRARKPSALKTFLRHLQVSARPACWRAAVMSSAERRVAALQRDSFGSGTEGTCAASNTARQWARRSAMRFSKPRSLGS